MPATNSAGYTTRRDFKEVTATAMGISSCAPSVVVIRATTVPRATEASRAVMANPSVVEPRPASGPFPAKVRLTSRLAGLLAIVAARPLNGTSPKFSKVIWPVTLLFSVTFTVSIGSLLRPIKVKLSWMVAWVVPGCVAPISYKPASPGRGWKVTLKFPAASVSAEMSRWVPRTWR